MNNVKELKSYIKEGKIDLEKIINDFSPYIRKIKQKYYTLGLLYS